MATRDDIIRELLTGAEAYPLSKKYPKSSVYEIKKELIRSGQLPDSGVVVVDSEDNVPPFTRVPPVIPTPLPLEAAPQVAVKEREAGAETVDLGPTSLPVDAINRIRGILGITARPKVLSMPMPELLYPSMVIAVTELGFPPMRPDDFIDTVLYQWLEACDYIPFAYMKVSEIDRLAKKYSGVQTKGNGNGEATEEQPESEAEEATEEKPPESDAEAEVIAGETTEEINETEEESNEEAEAETNETTDNNVDEPHKPTVGDMLKCLRIENIRKGVESDS